MPELDTLKLIYYEIFVKVYIAFLAPLFSVAKTNLLNDFNQNFMTEEFRSAQHPIENRLHRAYFPGGVIFPELSESLIDEELNLKLLLVAAKINETNRHHIGLN